MSVSSGIGPRRVGPGRAGGGRPQSLAGPARQLFRRISDYFTPQVGRLTAISTLVVASAAVGAAFPILVGKVVDLLK